MQSLPSLAIIVRVLMLSQTFPPYNRTGAPLQAMYLTQALLKLGVEVEVLTSQPLGQNLIEYDFNGITVHYIPFVSFPGLQSVTRFAAAIIKARGLKKWDVLHGHALSPMVLGFALARPANNLPMLVKPSIGGDHKEGEVTRILQNPAAPILHAAVHRIDQFAVLDDLILKDLKRLHIPQNRINRVDNGIDLDRFRPADFEEKRKIRMELGITADLVFLFCGQLSDRKGIPNLLIAWEKIITNNSDTILVIVGDGPLVTQVQNKADQSNGRIIYLGLQDDVAPIIRMSDVLILPSSFESFGNVIIEALASGVPVASTHCGIAPKVIMPDKSGWLIENTSINAIQNTLQHVITVRAQLSGLAKRCRQIAETFSFNKIAEGYLKTYESMISTKR